MDREKIISQIELHAEQLLRNLKLLIPEGYQCFYTVDSHFEQYTAELISEDANFEEGAEGNDPGEILRWLLDSIPSEQSEQE